MVGDDVLITHDTGKSANVGPFSEQLGKIKDVPIIDCVVAHDCTYSGKTYYLAMYNALYIPSMKENLIPPFVIRRQGNIVNDIPKIQVLNPTEEDHCLILDHSRVKIPLKLDGITSFFHTRKPRMDEYQQAMASDQIIDLNVNESDWNPQDHQFAQDEENMLDFEGKMINPKYRKRMLLDNNIKCVKYQLSKVNVMPEDDYLVAKVAQLSVNDGGAQALPDNKCYDPQQPELRYLDETLDDRQFAENLVERVALSKFQGAIGSKTSAISMSKPKGISPEELAKVFRIDLPTAKQTLRNTSQRLKRSKNLTLHRRYRTNDRMLRYQHLREYFYMDTMFASSKSGKTTRGNMCMQLFVTDRGFVFVCPMKAKRDVHYALRLFFKKVGVPDAIICDRGKEQIEGNSQKLLQDSGTIIRTIEPNTPWANRAERYIGMFKQAIRNTLHETNCPIRLWDYCAEHLARVNNATAKNLYQLGSTTPHHTIYHREPDISNICQFKFYDWCYYREQTAKFPFPSKVLGRVLGPSEDVGNEMSQWILRVDGRVISRQTVRPLTEEEIRSPMEVARRKAFNEAIVRKLGDSITIPEGTYPTEYVPYEDDDIGEDNVGIPDTDEDEYDNLVNSELLLPHMDKQTHAVVAGRHVDKEGNLVGRTDPNPILNTAVYDVVFPDGSIKQYAANTIADNLFSQVDQDGHQYLMLDAITDHRKSDEAVPISDQYMTLKNGRKKLRQTTKGWDLCVQWKSGEEQWIPLKVLKESNPVEVADYAAANDLLNEPAFKWWANYILRKRDQIVAKVVSRVKKKTHKYGVQIPRSVKDAYELDRINGNNLWRTAIAKEMENVSIAFEIMDDDEALPAGYKPASCHLIFDVKMDFTRKARYVLDGHRTADPEDSTYAGVVSRESVRIALTHAALNSIDICAADILNAYLQAPSSERHYIPKCGIEFGLENVGKRAKIVRALYGGKTSGRDFRNHLRSCMVHLNFESCKADPDVWMRKTTKADGSKYYEYALLYVDDLLVVSEKAEGIIRQEIGKYFELKKASIGMPDIYLGGKVSRVELSNGAKAYTFSSSQYVKAAVSNVEQHLHRKGQKLPCRALAPLKSGYRPEIDVTDELDAVQASYYQSLIGILRWMVELGRLDITCEVSMMASHMALPRVGHLDQLFHMFAYLKRCHNSELVFDPSDRCINKDQFIQYDWTSSEYGDAHEELPMNAPEPRGLGFIMWAYVDADHAGNVITRRSRTGFLILLNSAPIYWTSKKQAGVETSSFGAEFMAMKHCTEYIRGLRYKLRMMGIPCREPSYVFGDNQSVLKNGTLPDSMLKKKSNSIAYNFVREGVARREWLLSYINTKENLADFLTKPLPSEQRMRLVRQVLHHI